MLRLPAFSDLLKQDIAVSTNASPADSRADRDRKLARDGITRTDPFVRKNALPIAHSRLPPLCRNERKSTSLMRQRAAKTLRSVRCTGTPKAAPGPKP